MKLLAKVAFIAAAIAVTLSGCSANDPLASQFKAGDNKNYIAGDGSVTEYPEANRGKSVAWSGPTDTGGILSSDMLTGVPIVMNFWYAGCAPCRAEAADLEKVHAQFAGKDVAFIGVNVRDGADTAKTFNSTFVVTYPSVTDLDGKVQMAFSSSVAPNAVPTTLVLDTQGRVAARVLGRGGNDGHTTFAQL